MKIIINPKYSFLTEFIHQLPDNFASEGEYIYNQRNVLKRYQAQGIDLIVKSFRIPIIVNKVAYTFFRKSKACRSYEYGLEILKRGGNTPEPIAYIEEYKVGLLNRCYYICTYNNKSVTVRDYMNGSYTGTDAEEVLRGFACFTARLHRAGILHIDYSPGNILMETKPDGTYSFSIIDINRLCFKKVSKDDAYRNFDRLALSVVVSTRLAELFADCCLFEREEAVRKINEYSDRFFLKRTMKLVTKSIKRDKGWSAVFFGPLQRYLFLRFIRTTLLKGSRNGCIYEEESRLYFAYIKQADDRQVLERMYQYTLGCST